MVWAALGDPNASIPTPQPVLMRPRRSADGAGADQSVTFVAPAALDDGLGRPAAACAAGWPGRADPESARRDMVNNDALPGIEIDPETFAITVDGELVVPRPPRRCRWPSCYSMF